MDKCKQLYKTWKICLLYLIVEYYRVIVTVLHGGARNEETRM